MASGEAVGVKLIRQRARGTPGTKRAAASDAALSGPNGVPAVLTMPSGRPVSSMRKSNDTGGAFPSRPAPASQPMVGLGIGASRAITATPSQLADPGTQFTSTRPDAAVLCEPPNSGVLIIGGGAIWPGAETETRTPSTPAMIKAIGRFLMSRKLACKCYPGKSATYTAVRPYSCLVTGWLDDSPPSTAIAWPLT